MWHIYRRRDIRGDGLAGEGYEVIEVTGKMSSVRPNFVRDGEEAKLLEIISNGASQTNAFFNHTVPDTFVPRNQRIKAKDGNEYEVLRDDLDYEQRAIVVRAIFGSSLQEIAEKREREAKVAKYEIPPWLGEKVNKIKAETTKAREA